MLRLLHLADVHFDTPFKTQSPELRRRLAETQREAFGRAVDLALLTPVDGVLIGGDLFDSEYLSFNTEMFLREQITRLDQASIPCLYATGNHDPGGSESRLKGIEWPASLRILDSDEPETVDLFDSSGRLLGRVVAAGHRNRFEAANLAQRFPVAEPGVPYVGLLHTFVTSAVQAEAHDRYAPCAIDDLLSKGYAYWALGHVHQRQQVDSRLEAWYPGVFHGRHFHETGQKGGLLVTIQPGGQATTEFVPLAPVCWEVLEIDQLEEVRNLEQLKAHIERRFESLRSMASTQVRDWCARFNLSGPCPLYPQLRNPEEREALAGFLQDSLGLLAAEIRTAELTRPIQVEAYREEAHIVAEVLDLLGAAAADDRLLAEITPDDLAAVVEGTEEVRAYLRRLLKGLDYEAVSRFLKGNHATQ